MSETDVVSKAKDFVDHWCPLFKEGRVWLEPWDKSASELLKRLQIETNACVDLSSLATVRKAWDTLSDLLRFLVEGALEVPYPGFVEEACITWWDSMTERQVELRCKVYEAYRAMAAYVMANLAIRRHNRGEALRWAALGYLADKLANHPGSGGNEVTLRYRLAVPDDTLSLLDEIVRESADAGRSRDGVERFPEWLLAKALDDPRGIFLVAPSELYSHHPCVPFVKAAANHVFQLNTNSTLKGSRLERFVAFLVSTVPGMRPRLRLLAPGATAEHDIVASLVGESPYPLPTRSTEWLIECKNRESPVPSEAVGHFLARMQHAGAKFGIIVAKGNVSGAKSKPKSKRNHEYAARFLTEFTMREGIVCLVVDSDELTSLGDDGTFRSLIDKKYEEMRFGNSRTPSSTQESKKPGKKRK